MPRRSLVLLTMLAAAAVAFSTATVLMSMGPVEPQDVARGPQFEVDPSWPKPLPNQWIIGAPAGIAVDRMDYIWVIHRPQTLTDDEKAAALTPGRSITCVPAPPVLQFDAAGNLIQAWGGPGRGYAWPTAEHGIYVDHQDNVWIAGNGARDGQVLKFSRKGQHLLTIGAPGVVGNDADTKHLNGAAAMAVDLHGDELFVADGYRNHRVIVFNAKTGAYKRHWGANGRPPGDPSVKGFGIPVHCVRLARDGLLYVCDRANNRIQVFKKDGSYVTEFVVAPETRRTGSVWDLGLSPDQAQTFLHAADGENDVVWNLLRSSGDVLGRLGRSGRLPGQLHWVHDVAVDSKGNLYTTEIETGKRAQRFVNKGGAK